MAKKKRQDGSLLARDQAVAPKLGFSGELRRPHVMGKAHLHNEVELNYLLSGSITYELVGGVRVQIPPRRLCVFWGATPHRLVDVKQCRQFHWITLPLAWVMAWKAPAAMLAAILGGNFIVEAEANSAVDEPGLRRWQKDLQATDPPVRETALLEIQASFRRLGRAWQRCPIEKSHAIGPKKSVDQVPTLDQSASNDRSGQIVRAIMTVIARRFAQNVSASDIAEAVQLHPNYAASVVRRRCGCTITRLLTMQRCFAARQRLVQTRDPILTIALDCGFNSVSRFYEAFDAIYNQTPGQCRRSVTSDDLSTT